MTAVSKGRDLFIVDNSVSGWTGLRYLEEWSGIAKAFDVATGYFESAHCLPSMADGRRSTTIRISDGCRDDVSYTHGAARRRSARAAQILDESLEADKDTNPFLHGVPAILAALRSGQITCRVYGKDKFHAKAYITHAKLEVVGSQALVGSSNSPHLVLRRTSSSISWSKAHARLPASGVVRDALERGGRGH